MAEELGIEYPGGRLLVVDWVAPHGPWDDSLVFIFDGGVLTAEQQTAIRLSDDELGEYRFHEPEMAGTLLRPYAWHRVQQALNAVSIAATLYLHDGRLV